jgi:hypothetical protein
MKPDEVIAYLEWVLSQESAKAAPKARAVIAHAKRQQRRGRKPAMALLGQKNPRLALEFARKILGVSKTQTKLNKKWRIKGYDTFEGGDAFYPLCGSYKNQQAAERAAQKRLDVLEATQPSYDSGGQGLDGIQDHVYVVRPDGSQYRFFMPMLVTTTDIQ